MFWNGWVPLQSENVRRRPPEDELHQWWMDVKVIGVGEMMVRKAGRFSTTKRRKSEQLRMFDGVLYG